MVDHLGRHQSWAVSCAQHPLTKQNIHFSVGNFIDDGSGGGDDDHGNDDDDNSNNQRDLMTTIINIRALPQPPTLLGHCTVRKS